MAVFFQQDLGAVRDYYTRPRVVDGKSRTIYQIWESGGAYDDSITPSTYCPEYQNHLSLKLRSLAMDSSRAIYSIGCGNAVIEGRLAHQGYAVRAIDCNEEAVKLARTKRVHAEVGDIMQVAADELDHVSVVYADGLVGHLLDPATGLRHFFRKLKNAGLGKGSYLLISNDAPRSGDAAFERHPRVHDFWLVSPDFVAMNAETEGYTMLEKYTFPYLRPLSGLHHRTILVVRS